MPGKRHSEEQILYALRQIEGGKKVSEVCRVNTKRVYRLYREEALQVRTKKRVKSAAQVRITLAEATFANPRWSMDFVSERLADERWFRILTILDQYTRECLCTYADRSQTARRSANNWTG